MMIYIRKKGIEYVGRKKFDGLFILQLVSTFF